MTSHLAQQLFVPQVTLSILVECIVAVRSHCDQVCIHFNVLININNFLQLININNFTEVVDIFMCIAFVSVYLLYM